jgi:hypothetical protein
MGFKANNQANPPGAEATDRVERRVRPSCSTYDK